MKPNMRPRLAFMCLTVLMSILARPVHAQAVANPDLPATAADSVFQRARQLVLSGSGAAGRLLVDSVIAANLPDTPVYADALFWRATLATDTLDAEGDFRRIIVEYPLSRHANDALLQLGESEAARGERTAASAHLERYLLENPATPERARIGLQVVKLSFDMHDAQRGCTTLGRVLRDVPADAVEMRNQLEYYQPRCAGVDTTRAEASADSVPTVVPPPLAITAGRAAAMP